MPRRQPSGTPSAPAKRAVEEKEETSRKRGPLTRSQSRLTATATAPPSSTSHSTYSGYCLLPLLQPIRPCFQPFVSAKDAVRLMQTSRSITAALLADYAFVDHVFTNNNHTAAQVERSLAFYAHYRMRILRLCLSATECDSQLLPPSLIALVLSHCSFKSVAYAALDGGGGGDGGVVADDGDHSVHDARGSSTHRSKQPDMDDCIYSIIGKRSANSESGIDVTDWDVLCYGRSHEYYVESFNRHIPPGSLPRGLRFLQLCGSCNQPLQPGSIPDSVEVLKFGQYFNQPLAVGHLPASLTHLVFGDQFNHPLLPGALPAGLRRLRLGNNYNQPLSPGTFPPQLQQLSFGDAFNQPIAPGIIPSSVTHLRLGTCFDQPLLPGSIPHGVYHLVLHGHFDQPLLPGVLPSTLRVLFLSEQFNHPLQPGSLPDGLEVLAFHYDSVFRRTLLPGAIPASVVVVRLGHPYRRRLVAGGIPATVRWLRLSLDAYGEQDLSEVLSSNTDWEWWG